MLIKESEDLEALELEQINVNDWPIEETRERNKRRIVLVTSEAIYYKLVNI